MDLRIPALRPAGALLAATVVLGASTARDAWQLHRIHGWNTAIAAHTRAGGPPGGGPPADGRADAAEGGPDALRFARAYAAAQAGDVQGALDGYRALESAGDPRLRRDARFNSGNLYLAQSRAHPAGADPSATLTLIELAKQSYREVLREDDQDWDARYNLEQALRLAPDADRDDESLPPPPDSRHAPSTARGVPLGLP